MDEIEKFAHEVAKNIAGLSADDKLQAKTLDWMLHAGGEHRYSYNFSWMGRPIIQYPQDIVGMQELIWEVRPDLIVETGIAHGGSLILSASMLAMLDYCDAVATAKDLVPNASKRKVVGVDIDIRSHNFDAIKAHPMSHMISMIEGSSTDPEVVGQVKDIARQYEKIMVVLDSNHTHEHVMEELESYASLTSVNSYCIVFDTIVENTPEEWSHGRPWGPGNNPKTAVWEYLKSHPEFEIDKSIQHKLLITVAPDGYLKRVC